MTYPLSFEATSIICFFIGLATLMTGCFLVDAWRHKLEEETTRLGIRTLILAGLFVFFLIIIFNYPACTNCGEKTNTDYCTSCGIIVKENITPVCPECDKICYTNFCGSCGTPINQEG